MRIVVNHLTRMQPGIICVAGIDPQTRTHIRPVLVGRQQLRRDLLSFHPGPFNIAALVDLGPTQSVGSPPETEDHRFWPVRAGLIRNLDADLFWRVLADAAQDDLRAIFGPTLVQHGNTFVVPLGTGTASLGCLLPTGRVALRIDDHDRVRVHLRVDDHELALPVTDLRYYQDDQQTIRRAAVVDSNTRLGAGVPCILSVGLTRPWQKDGEREKRHWLQINGIHLRDNPTWQAEADQPNT